MNRIASGISFGFTMLIAGLSFAPSASADTQRHLNHLAASIERQANALIGESRHYRHTPSYRAMLSESIKLRDTARHVRATTFCTKSFRHLEQDLRILNACFNNLEDLFDGTECNAAHGIGHIRGNTRHVKRMLNFLENDIRTMRRLVRILRRELFPAQSGYGYGYGERSAVDVYRQPYRGGGYGRSYGPRYDRSRYDRPRINPQRCDDFGCYPSYGGGGLSLNRGGFSVRIGF